ncbi:hypothetical protein HID58_000084 [Brassica napus]|uniref:Ferredoxin-thioredoxin reductase catalytic chain, chloroplastic n=2 Tax=Brassica napus TaxID=3708 RepID=A0ABQ8EGK2_BRANA|nr:hypothetical protein HID58_013858 [Brassica napus]KAH0940447.1 hypothetical protein HID58_000084 [Brassica napus]
MVCSSALGRLLNVSPHSGSGLALSPPFSPPLHRSAVFELVAANLSCVKKSVEIMRKFSEQYARCSGTYLCVDKGVTSVVIKVCKLTLKSPTFWVDSTHESLRRRRRLKKLDGGGLGINSGGLGVDNGG